MGWSTGEHLGQQRAELIERLRDHVRFARSSKLSRLARHPVRFARVAGHRYLPWAIHELKTVRSFAGHTYRVELSSASQELYKYAFHEADLTMACLLLVSPGSVFVDIGANYGYFTVLAADLVGPTGQVYAFEPTPRTFGVLRTNVAALRNVVTEAVAVSSGAGTATLHDYGAEYSGFNTLSGQPRTGRKLTSTVQTVPTVSLDDYFRKLRKPAFVKVDAENAEMQILAGMGRTFSESRPMVSLEVGDPNPNQIGQSNDLIRFMTDRGYRPFEVRDARLVPHVQRSSYVFENLVFIPRAASS